MSELSERLVQARRDAGFESAEEAAASLGVKYPTYAGHENGARGFKRQSAVHYAKRFKVSLEWLLTGAKKQISAVGAIPVIGKVRAGGWLEVDELNSEIENDFQQIAASMEFPIEWQYAFTVEGNSINKIATDGDKLICIDMIQSGIDIMDDDLVIVERVKHEGSMIERTAKRVRKTSAGYDLWPESTDPDHQSPMPLNGASSHEEVRVRAKVIWIMKKP